MIYVEFKGVQMGAALQLEVRHTWVVNIPRILQRQFA